MSITEIQIHEKALSLPLLQEFFRRPQRNGPLHNYLALDSVQLALFQDKQQNMEDPVTWAVKEPPR
jgi:hypothetical protein